MSRPLEATLAAVMIVGLLPANAPAEPRQKTHHVRSQSPDHRESAYAAPVRGYAGDPDDPYNPYAPPGAAIRAQARINQAAPGVTNELAPDNIATATGGPAGGVPGFSGR